MAPKPRNHTRNVNNVELLQDPAEVPLRFETRRERGVWVDRPTWSLVDLSIQENRAIFEEVIANDTPNNQDRIRAMMGVNIYQL